MDDSDVPKQSDWRFNVTTCIAAICGRTGLDDVPDKIVTASDTKLSLGDYSAEGSVKLHMFHHDWMVMIAGDDISQYVHVINRAKDLLRGKPGTLPIVASALKQAYQDQLREIVEDDLLSRYKMTITEFKRNGQKQLHPEIFLELSLKIKLYTLGSTFLVCGLDDFGIAHIFTVRNPGRVDNHDKPGFWAIGSGARPAITMLSALKQVRGRTTFAETVYNVLASKYFSEKASDVGEETYLWVQMQGTSGFMTRRGLEDDIRKIWQKEGMPKTSGDAVQQIQNGEWKFFPRTKRSKIRTLIPWQ